ncbi:hypothetical protein MHYP_G00268330 [Metynnis hypsauchen]
MIGPESRGLCCGASVSVYKALAIQERSELAGVEKEAVWEEGFQISKTSTAVGCEVTECTVTAQWPFSRCATGSVHQEGAGGICVSGAAVKQRAVLKGSFWSPGLQLQSRCGRRSTAPVPARLNLQMGPIQPQRHHPWSPPLLLAQMHAAGRVACFSSAVLLWSGLCLRYRAGL